jgi:hypothetical protein
MTGWRPQAFASILFAIAAVVPALAGGADAQTAVPPTKIGGAWDTTWGGGNAVLNLTQTGSTVMGTYSGTNEGKVKGTLAGNVLTGNWLGAANDSGGFVLKFSTDGRSFTGTWGMGGSKTDGGPWVGARK